MESGRFLFFIIKQIYYDALYDGTLKNIAFCDKWRKYKQLETTETIEAWPGTFNGGNIHKFQPVTIHTKITSSSRTKDILTRTWSGFPYRQTDTAEQALQLGIKNESLKTGAWKSMSMVWVGK